MGKYGYNKKILDQATTINAYQYVYFINSGFSAIRFTTLEHNVNAIKFIIERSPVDDDNWIEEKAEAILTNAIDESDIDPMSNKYRIGYKASVADTHGEVSIWVNARVNYAG